jgi:Mrp family chromosome partitioning ATPase
LCANSSQLDDGDAEGGVPGWALIVLLDDEREARALSRFLGALRDPTSPVDADLLVPPVRGLAFFADESRQRDIDAWWSEYVSRSATPVFLLMDVAGLEGWVGEVDGDVYVGLSDRERMSVYTGLSAPPRGRIHPLLCDGPLELAAAVIHDLSNGRRRRGALFDSADALRVAALSPRFPRRGSLEGTSDRSRPGLLQDPWEEALWSEKEAASAGDSRSDARGSLVPSAPSRLRHDAPATEEPASASPSSSARGSALTALQLSARSAGRWVLQRLRHAAERPRPDAEVARQLAARGPTIVVIGSRKGGVGKTSFAAGISVTAGGILDQIGHRACIVDANIANPDAWGELHLPRGAATVREVTTALLSNREPPPPVHAATAGLACYPEVREPTEYSRTAVRVLADFLRRRYTFIVVDMSNRLPDPTAGPEAAVAAYWLEVADVLILPTTSARADFNGALDYLDIAELPPTLVPYIVPDDRRLRDNPTTLEYLRAIRRKAHGVVAIPDEANLVRLAGMEGVPVEQLSARLRLAYRLLTEAIADVPRRRR